MFKFDEAAVNMLFGSWLDITSPNVASRSADFQKPSWPSLLWLARLTALQPFRYTHFELGLKVIVDDKLTSPRNNDAINLIIHQAINAIMAGLMRYRDAIGYPLSVGPLHFCYDWGMCAVDGSMIAGTEAVIETTISWRPLG